MINYLFVSCSAKPTKVSPKTILENLAWEEVLRTIRPLTDERGETVSVPGLTVSPLIVTGAEAEAQRAASPDAATYTYSSPEGTQVTYSLPIASPEGTDVDCSQAAYQSTIPKLSDITSSMDTFVFCLRVANDAGQVEFIRSPKQTVSHTDNIADNDGDTDGDTSGDGNTTTPLNLTAPASFSDGVKTTVQNSSPQFAWTAPTDSGAGISHYEVKIGTTAGGDDIMPYTNVGNVLQYTKTGLSLNWGQTYFASVRAVDSDGQQSTAAQGDGFRAGTLITHNLDTLLVYYGWPSAINSCADTTCAANEYKQHSAVILGLNNNAPFRAIPSLSFIQEDDSSADSGTKIVKRHVYAIDGQLRGEVSFDWTNKTTDMLTVLP